MAAGMTGFEVILNYLDGFRLSKTLFAASSLGVFDALEKESSSGYTTVAALSQELSVNEDGLQRLLQALTSMGLVEYSSTANGYRNTSIAKDFLVRSSPMSCQGYITHSDKLLYPMWGDLEGAVREGSNRWQSVFGSSSAQAFANYYKEPEQLMQFLKGMNSFGAMTSPIVVRAFDLSPFRHLVDVGGATGHVAKAACEAYPHLTATVFELPVVLERVQSLLNDSSSSGTGPGRITTCAGDFFTSGSLPAGDLMVLSRILHDWDDRKCHEILRNVYEALEEGGACLVFEMVLDQDPAQGPLRAQLQSLNMLVQTEGKERTAQEYQKLLERVGFVEMKVEKTGAYLDAIMAYKRREGTKPPS